MSGILGGSGNNPKYLRRQVIAKTAQGVGESNLSNIEPSQRRRKRVVILGVGGGYGLVAQKNHNFQ
jgi:hypothetical protein